MQLESHVRHQPFCSGIAAMLCTELKASSLKSKVPQADRIKSTVLPLYSCAVDRCDKHDISDKPTLRMTPAKAVEIKSGTMLSRSKNLCDHIWLHPVSAAAT